LKKVVEETAPEIIEWMRPETKTVDLGPVQRMWSTLAPDPLPEEFSWERVAQNFATEIRRFVKSNPALRERLSIDLLEQMSNDLGLMAGPSPGFDLQGYRAYIKSRCSSLQLSVMHTSTYGYDLWLAVFFRGAAAQRKYYLDLDKAMNVIGTWQILNERTERILTAKV
jgi:hypothetical protein